MAVATQSLKRWLGFIKGNALEVFKGILRVNLCIAATIILGLIILVAVSAVVWTAGDKISGLIKIGAFILFVVFLALSQAFLAPLYRTIHAIYERKERVNILKVAKERARPIIIYQIIVTLLYVLAVILIIGPSVILILINFNVTNTAGPFIIAVVVFGILLQFAFYELGVSNKGPIESIKASISLVIHNIRNSLALTVARGAVSSAVGIAFTVLFYIVMKFILQNTTIEVTDISSLEPFFVFLGMIIFGVYVLFYVTLIETVELPMTYVFWRALSDNKTFDLCKRV